jgi:hypothetical protein
MAFLLLLLLLVVAPTYRVPASRATAVNPMVALPST